MAGGMPGEARGGFLTESGQLVGYGTMAVIRKGRGGSDITAQAEVIAELFQMAT
jgi:hypothetical protein